MTPEDFVVAQIAGFAFQEVAHMGGEEPMLAVACVLRNRMKAGWFGKDWLAIVNGAGETAALDPVLPRPFEVSSRPMKRLLRDVGDIYMGSFTDELTSEALYYLDPFYPDHGRTLRPWFRDQILTQGQTHPRVAQVGMLMLFR